MVLYQSTLDICIKMKDPGAKSPGIFRRNGFHAPYFCIRICLLMSAIADRSERSVRTVCLRFLWNNRLNMWNTSFQSPVGGWTEGLQEQKAPCGAVCSCVIALDGF